jgi:hypothetical protein
LTQKKCPQKRAFESGKSADYLEAADALGAAVVAFAAEAGAAFMSAFAAEAAGAAAGVAAKAPTAKRPETRAARSLFMFNFLKL